MVDLGRGTELIVYDPREFLKVFRADGMYPDGGAGKDAHWISNK